MRTSVSELSLSFPSYLVSRYCFSCIPSPFFWVILNGMQIVYLQQHPYISHILTYQYLEMLASCNSNLTSIFEVMENVYSVDANNGASPPCSFMSPR